MGFTCGQCNAETESGNVEKMLCVECSIKDRVRTKGIPARRPGNKQKIKQHRMQAHIKDAKEWMETYQLVKSIHADDNNDNVKFTS